MTTDPTPAATARDALVAKVTSDWDADPYGEYEAARSRLIADLDNLIAHAAAEAPGRVAALEAVAAAAATFIRRWDDRKYSDAADMVGHCWESIGALRDALAAPAPTPGPR